MSNTEGQYQRSVAEGPLSSAQESDHSEPGSEATGDSQAEQGAGRAWPISEEERAPSASAVAPREVSESRAGTPRPTIAREHMSGLPPCFPSPLSRPRDTPPGCHRGPASTSSLSTYHPPLNPLAVEFTPADPARAFLTRGPPPGTRDPTDVPNDPAAGNVAANPANIGRYMRSATRHAAMVYKRLLDADSELDADRLDREFTRVFGEPYRQEVVRIIGDPPDSTVASNDGRGDEELGEDEEDLYRRG